MTDSNDAIRKQIKSIGAAEFARISGVQATTIYSFLQNTSQNPRSDTMQKIRAGLAKSALAKQIAKTDDSEFRTIPIYDIRASAGAGALVEDGEPTCYQPFREPEIARFTISDLAVIQVGGDSMWSTLHDGDKVLINRGEQRIVKPGIYVLSYEGALIVKRCQRNLETGAVIVQSDNPDYQTFTVTDADSLDVIGRVVWIGRAIG